MADRERDRRSLQDLAKMAQMTPPPPSVSSTSGVQRAAEAKKDDSGIVDLALAAVADPQAETRAKATPLAAEGLFDDEPASVRPPPSAANALAQQPPSLPPMPASVPPGPASVPPSLRATPSVPSVAPSQLAQLAAKPTAASSKKRGSGAVIALVFGGLVAASAAAAGVFFVAKHRLPLQPAVVAVAETGAAAAPTAAPTVASTSNTVATTADPATPPPADALDPNALPTADKQLAAAPKTVAHGASRPKDTEPPARVEAAKPEPPKVAQNDLPKGTPGSSDSLGSAIQKEVGTQGQGQVQPAAGPTGGAQFAPGSVPQKPSQGAITGALGAVLPRARQCLGPDDPVSHASITFGSDGSVQSVSVSGGAAGKPAEGCIKSALMTAKVAPFAEATYSTRITVRH